MILDKLNWSKKYKVTYLADTEDGHKAGEEYTDCLIEQGGGGHLIFSVNGFDVDEWMEDNDLIDMSECPDDEFCSVNQSDIDEGRVVIEEFFVETNKSE
jgi:hypothetical protein